MADTTKKSPTAGIAKKSRTPQKPQQTTGTTAARGATTTPPRPARARVASDGANRASPAKGKTTAPPTTPPRQKRKRTGQWMPPSPPYRADGEPLRPAVPPAKGKARRGVAGAKAVARRAAAKAGARRTAATTKKVQVKADGVAPDGEAGSVDGGRRRGRAKASPKKQPSPKRAKQERADKAKASEAQAGEASAAEAPGPKRPKRPASAYWIHLTQVRDDISKANREKNGGKLKLGEVAKEIAAKWAAVSDEAKQDYKNQAAADKKRYEAELKAYKDAGGKVGSSQLKVQKTIAKKYLGMLGKSRIAAAKARLASTPKRTASSTPKRATRTAPRKAVAKSAVAPMARKAPAEGSKMASVLDRIRAKMQEKENA